MNFQIFKLYLEKAKEPEIKLPTSLGPSKKQESFRKTYTSALLTMPKPLCGSQQIGENSYRDQEQTTLSISWEICMQVKNQQLEPDVEQQTGSKLGKEYVKAVYCHPVCLTYMQNIIWNAGLDEAQAGFKIARGYINNLRYADDTTLMAETKEEIKRLLMKVKEESEKVGLRLNIQKTKIMASGPITSWQIDEETMETVRDFILGGSKITADGDCSHEIKRHLLLGRKAMTNLDSILKTLTFANKGLSSQSCGFSSSHVWM